MMNGLKNFQKPLCYQAGRTYWQRKLTFCGLIASFLLKSTIFFRRMYEKKKELCFLHMLSVNTRVSEFLIRVKLIFKECPCLFQCQMLFEDHDTSNLLVTKKYEKNHKNEIGLSRNVAFDNRVQMAK